MFNLSNFYKSREWQEFRNTIILSRVNDNGDVVCEHCNKVIVNNYDCIAHHKQHLTESNVNDFSISLNPENISLVHHKCHNEIHNRFGSYTRHIYIVYGSPCAGKSYYVDSVANKDDLIICIDRLYEAINNSRSNRVYSNVMSLYRSLIDMVKTRNGKWVNCYIIRTFPNRAERERLAKELDAEFIFINTDKNTCLHRAEKRQIGYNKIVEDWWDKFQE